MSNQYTIFRGKDAVITAYEFNKVAPWALFVGKDPMFSYEGQDLEVGAAELGEVIQSLIDNGMQGTMQLKIYREVPRGGIVNTTPHNFSFRFQLYLDDEFNSRNPLQLQLQAMKEEIRKLKEEPDQEEEEDDYSLQGQIAGIFKDPDTRKMILAGIIGWVKSTFGKQNAGSAAMAGVSTMAETTQQGTQPTSEQLYNRLTPEEQQKFSQATYVLMYLDPKIGTHLLKLADLLQNKPDTYEALTKM